MADLLEILKHRFEHLSDEFSQVLSRLNPTSESGEQVISTQVEKLKEKLEDNTSEAGGLVLSRLNQQLVKYGVILKDDLDKLEERIDRLEAEIREL